MSTQIQGHKQTESNTRQMETTTRIATSIIERKIKYGDPVSLVGVGAVAKLTIGELKERELKVKWNEISRLVEDILLNFYSAVLWNREENPTISKRLYKVRRF